MARRTFWSVGISALILGGSVMGCTGGSGVGVQTASSRGQATASREAGYAQKALDKHDSTTAVAHAEASVALAPQSFANRALLARSYLLAGRLTSARTTFEDALSLDPDDGRIALNLALCRIALGDWQSARQTLERYAQVIPVSDLGLAVALSGDPAGGVTILTQAARLPNANAKTRQNLALTLALAGQWNAARIVAAADMSPADVDSRLEQWAAFANPANAAEQVAALLGIHPTSDPGQPAAIALNTAPSHGVEVVHEALPPVTDAPRPPVEQAARDEPTQTTPVVRTTFAAESAARFAEPDEVVQTVPVRMIRADQAAATHARVAARASRKTKEAVAGDWYVQIGAYDSPGVARDAWSRARRRFATFRQHVPNGMIFAANGTNFYRLSVGGFARRLAEATCLQYRRQGGSCFVRLDAGDRTASWIARPGVQVATR